MVQHETVQTAQVGKARVILCGLVGAARSAVGHPNGLEPGQWGGHAEGASGGGGEMDGVIASQTHLRAPLHQG